MMNNDILILLILLILIIGMVLLAFQFKKMNQTMISDLSERVEQAFDQNEERLLIKEKQQLETLYQFQERMQKSSQLQNKILEDNLDKRLYNLDLKVNQSLEKGFSQTHHTFTNVVERLAKIDGAQKKIDGLSKEIISLQDILTDKSSRGAFGEIQLNQILYSVFGEKNDKVYQTQYKLSNNKIADVMLFAPEPLGNIAIDSKFPLENYERIIRADKALKSTYEKDFVRDFKKHIDDIADKYIIKGETADQAFLFLPAEAIFAYINAYHPELITYSQKRCVWIVSPTTLISTLTTIQSILKNLEREKYAHIIQEELENLGIEFTRYHERWQDLSRHVEMVNKDIARLHITSEKISKQFDAISQVDKALFKDD